MLPMPIRYPLDPTGVNPDNLVKNEPHELVNRHYRPVVLDYGAFFTESLIITDAATGTPLRNDQFVATELYALPTARYGKEICSVILVIDPVVSGNITVDYQALGGEYSYSNQAVEQQILALNLDDRPVAWPAVIGKPSAYKPTQHLHDVGDVYGFEYVVHAIDRLCAAVELGDAASHDAILAYIDKIRDGLNTLITGLNDNLHAHMTDYNNPHKTTASQVGAYTTEEVNLLMSSLNRGLTQHTTDYGNPHKVTAAQAGAYTTQQVDSISSALSTRLELLKTAHNTANIFDIPFIAGWGSDMAGEDLEVRVQSTLMASRDVTVSDLIGSIDIPASGANIIVDIRVNGVTIFNTYPMFAAGQYQLTAGVINPAKARIYPFDKIDFALLQVGTSTKGRKIRLSLRSFVTNAVAS
jgi:hypothetical protein